ncbi:M23 family metallopeptidase [Streptomyces sp. NPDC097619]|uniref:M23 family metallopeptidase n=1 Tax=Streptomyces sp. NPDC097619 TaxID=3157228 RepID=UPI0033271310
MNDRPPSGPYPDSGYDGLATTTFAGDGYYSAESAPQQTQGHGFAYDPYGTFGGQQGFGAEATGTYDSSAWASQEAYLSAIPAQSAPEDVTGQWDANAWNAAGQQTGAFGYDTGGQDTGHWAMPAYGVATETGAFDATAWNGAAEELPQQYAPAYEALSGHEAYPAPAAEDHGTAGHLSYPEQSPEDPGHAAADHTGYPAAAEYAEYGTSAGYAVAEYPEYTEFAEYAHHQDPEALAETEPAATTAVFELPLDEESGAGPAPQPTGPSRSARRAAPAANARSARRRTPAKRSALLTVAVPSACVMGVAGVAAASVGGLTGNQQPVEDQPVAMSAPDPASVKPVAANRQLDTQLAALSADAGDFADRASRTQERIDLKVRQEAERKKRAEEAARKEALRPKFALPVAQHGLSAGYGQSGVNWMSLHTGIDFPVSYGTPVMAATDGTVRTQWNSAYGNMAIVTSPDGTETWYCHLSSTKIRSGPVKAGDVIAYSGNSGNSTGPHLHFEVRPGGGSAIDPLTWLRSHGLNPT